MSWVLVDGHDFRTQELADRFRYAMKRRAISMAAEKYIGVPLAIALALYVSIDVVGLPYLVHMFGNPNAKFPPILLLSFIPNVILFIPTAYYSRIARQIHTSEDCKCYTEHHKRRKNEDGDPSTHVSLPFPEVKV